jgi:hypothetical protein
MHRSLDFPATLLGGLVGVEVEPLAYLREATLWAVLRLGTVTLARDLESS